MKITKTFVIDSLPENAGKYGAGWTVVAIDVIRATTMAITAVALGRRCYCAPSLEAAFRLAGGLSNPLLAGEVGGVKPAGLEMNNSPAALARRRDIARPLVMVSSSGTRLIAQASGSGALYLACFRNALCVASRLATLGRPRIALLGAGSRGEFREEDQICCAWIAARLARSGYRPENSASGELLHRWAGAKASACVMSRSVEYLHRTGQLADLRFILRHVNDLDAAFVVRNGEVTAADPAGRRFESEYPTPVAVGTLA